MCKICGFKTEKLIINSILYHRCTNCGFLRKDEKHLLDDNEEFERYQKHNNNDENYVSYQRNFYLQIEQYLFNDVLDFGCGDNHVLSSIIKENGFNSYFYDLYFYNDETIFSKLYDVIILEEVIEHIENPLFLLKRLIEMLKVDGKIIIRTNMLKDTINLNSWWYLRDTTHISFFTYHSFLICSQLLGMNIIYCNEKDLIIMKKA